VFDYAHLGNLITDHFEDLTAPHARLAWLSCHARDEYHRCGRSGADTGEDKLEQGARRTGASAREVAALSTQAFKD
jgi:cysteinyl-tRNA synthetase